jgi:hypothetical protein
MLVELKPLELGQDAVSYSLSSNTSGIGDKENGSLHGSFPAPWCCMSGTLAHAPGALLACFFTHWY